MPNRFALVFLLCASMAAQGKPPLNLPDWDPVGNGVHRSGAAYPAVYSIGPQGELRIWPSARTANPKTPPETLFKTGSKDFLPRFLTRSSGITWLLALCHGRSDLASLTDPRYHFDRLALNSSPAALRQRIENSARHDLAEPLRIRESLNRFLAVRLAAQRGLGQLTPALHRLAGNQAEDLPLRLAAHRALARLNPEFGALPRLELPPLTPVADIAASIPAGACLVLRIDQARVTSLPRLTVLNQAWVQRVILDRLRQAGGVNRSAFMLCGMQQLADRDLWLGFELARRLGNAWIRRSILALAPGPQAKKGQTLPRMWIHLDGIFDLPRLRKGLQEHFGARVQRLRDEGLQATLSNLELRATSNRLIIRSWDFRSGSKSSAPRLPGAGLSDEAPIWGWARNPAPHRPLSLLVDKSLPACGDLRLRAWLEPDKGLRIKLKCAEVQTRQTLETLILAQRDKFIDQLRDLGLDQAPEKLLQVQCNTKTPATLELRSPLSRSRIEGAISALRRGL